MRHGVEKVGVLEKSLGGNTAPVEAGSARSLDLHTGDFLAQLPGPDSSHIAAGTTTNHHEIV